MANKNDETLTYRIKAEGEAELRALAKGISGVGDASGEAEKQANALLDEFADTARLQAAAKRYREVGTSVLEYQQQLRASISTINELAAEERKLSAVEQERSSALAAAKAQLASYKDGTHGLSGSTKDIAAAQKAAGDEVKRLTGEYRDSVKARQAVSTELERERAEASKAAAARDREIAQAKELRAQLEANGQSVTRIGALERQLAADSDRVSSSMRQLAAATQASRIAQDEKAQADQRAAAESTALARAAEIEADALKAIARAERDAAQNRDVSERSIERINDAVEMQSRKLAALRSDLSSAGASTEALSRIEAGLVQRATAAADALQREAAAARASRAAHDSKVQADQRAKAEADAYARALELQGDAFKAIERAERAATADRDKTQRSLERINDAYDAYSRKLGALERDLQAAGASTQRLNDIGRALFTRTYDSVQALRSEGEAARFGATASDRLSAAKEAERQQTLRNIQATVAGRNAQIAASEALARYRARGKEVTDANVSMGGSFSKLRGLVTAAVSALSFGSLVEGAKRILTLGDASERAQIQLKGLYGSSADGNRAFTELRKLSREQGQDFDVLQRAAVKFKTAGLDPLNGSLQAAIDANARAGGSNEKLEGIVLALSQTYAKARIQQEEMNQLSERGIPSMEILAKVTGKQGDELLKLVSSGKLGKEAIAAFIAELGKISAGAAVENLNTLSGLFTALKSRADDFLRTIGNSGTLDYFKGKVRDAIAKIEQLQKSGDLDRWAKRISDAITGVTQALIDATRWLVDHGREIANLAAIYAGFKVAGFLVNIYAATRALIANSAAARANAIANAASGAAASGAGGSFSMLARAIGFIRGNPAILAIGTAAIISANKVVELVDRLEDLHAVNIRIADEEDGARQAKEGLIRSIERLKQAGSDYREVIALTEEDIAKLTEVELLTYRQRLERAQGFWRASALEAKMAGKELELTSAQEELKKIDSLLGLVKTRTSELETAAVNGSKRFTDFAKTAVEAFDKARTEGDTAREAMKKVFNDLDFTKTDALKSIPGVFEQIGARGRDAGVAVREGLTAALTDLSGRELLTFQRNTEEAIRNGTLAVTDGARIVESTLLAAMQKLNVEPAKFGTGMTAAGKDAVATFKVVTESILASSNQISAAFKAALAGATTKEEAAAIGEAMKRAGERGKIGLDQARDAAAAVSLKMREIKIASDPLASDLEKLGIKTKAALDLARDSAKQTFEAVVRGAREGRYAQEDVRAAFMAYAQSVRDSTENSQQWQKSTAEAQLSVVASTYGLTDALKSMGDAGEDAGKRTADSAKEASKALDGTADSADHAADAADGLGRSSHRAADGLGRVAANAAAAEAASFNASKQFADSAAMAGRLDRVTFGLAQAEQARAQAHLADLQAQIASYDELTQRVEGLRATYKNLGDDTLRAIAQAEMQLAQAQQQRAQDAQEQQRKAQEARSRDAGDEAASQGGGGGAVRRVEVNVTLTGKAGAGLADMDNATLVDLARKMAPQLSRLIQRGVPFG